jgi:hypothetical protein
MHYLSFLSCEYQNRPPKACVDEMEAESGNSRLFEQRGKASPFAGDTDAVVHDVRGYFGRRNAEGEILLITE